MKLHTIPKQLGRISLVCLSLAMAALACNFPGLAEPPTPTATPVLNGLLITEAVNQVVTRQSIGAPEAAAVSGQLLPLGAIVETRGESKAKLEIPGSGGLARLGPDSNLTVLELPLQGLGSQSRFGLLAGHVYLILQDGAAEAAVETPSGVATLRGPQMGVEYIDNYNGSGKGLMRVTCPGGGCTVDNIFGGLQLPAGYQTEAAGADGAYDAFPMDPEQWEDWYANVPEASPPPSSPTATPTATATSTVTPTGTVPATATPTITPTATRRVGPTATRFIVTVTRTFTATVPTTAAPSKPGASISADANTLEQGQCTTLRWTATNAREVYLNGQGIAGETSRQVCPSQTTTYTLRVVGHDNSTAEASTTITVNPAANPPSASIRADDTDLEKGECTTLRWSVANAREVYLNGQGIAGETSREVCPNQTTTYTLRVVGYDNSSVEASTTVNVSEPPESYPDPTISADPSKVEIPEFGEACPNRVNTTIYWSAEGATSVVIDGLGTVGSSGSRGVCVTTTTTFRLIANYPDGSRRTASTSVEAVFVIG